MATSGSRNWILTRDNIIYAALENVGAYAVGIETPRAEYVTMAATALNVMVQHWQNLGLYLWSHADDVQVLTAATKNYTLDADIIGIDKVFFRHDGDDKKLTSMTREEYKDTYDKDEVGEPTHYYYDPLLAAPVLYLWPVYDHTTTVRTGSDSNVYLTIVDHTSATATNKPITGSSYTTYWESTTETTGGAWANATAYYSGIVRFTKYQRLQDFDASTDNPDAPVRGYQALISGLAFRLAPKFGIRAGTEYDRLKLQAEQDFLEMMAGNRESADLRIRPRMI